ncbi:MAG: ATP-binding cassette domain-containing protein [Chromatiales bacterium]|nr:ATP-binding cassette domain-containing protein [Chromatiales bacterium]
MRLEEVSANPGPPVLPICANDVAVTRRGRTLLNVTDLCFEGTDLTVLLGPNGAGKSLLLRALANLIQPDRGEITWAGTKPNRQRALRVGFVFQRPVLLRRSAASNVAFALATAGWGWGARRAKARELLALAGLGHLSTAPAAVLSGGERQRVALVRALATNPEVLFLDEPAASLDPAATAAIETILCETKRNGTKVVLVTHDIGQAKRLADDIMFMHAGRVIERTRARQFFINPTSQPAAKFVDGQLLT